MTRRKILACCALLLLAGAVVHKSREVAGLREQVRHLTIDSQTPSSVATKHRGNGPSSGFNEANGDPSAEDDEDLIQGSAVTPGGGLSKGAIERLDLTGFEIDSLTEAIKRLRTEARQDLAKRVKPTASHSDDGSHHHFYYARARPDRGQAFADAVSLEFGSILGRDRSRPLVKSFLRDDLSGRAGKMDLEFEVVHQPEEEVKVKVNFQLRSPRTGGVSTFGGSPLAEFEEKFGKLFELPEAE